MRLNISENRLRGIIKKTLNEYLDKKTLAPLKRYFDEFDFDDNMEEAPNGNKYWNGEYSPRQLQDLEEKFPQYYVDFLKREALENMEDDNDDEYYAMEEELDEYESKLYEFEDDEDEVKRLYNELMSKYGRRDEYRRWLGRMMRTRYYRNTPPTWMYQKYSDIHKKRDWLIHFGNARSIVKDGGFRIGGALDKLSITTGENQGDYAFAYPLDDWFFFHQKNASGYLTAEYCLYAKEAVIFQANGIKTWHFGDHEFQVIFDKNAATNMVPVYYNEDEKYWFVINRTNNRPLVKRDNIYDIAKWVMTNFQQYKDKIQI